ncbi:MAG: RNA polymerase sigma factor, partial [Bacteroidetes bacterium]|nr:RNA polymerase sigma factor [Bacteroidota bacterium]
IQLWKSWPKFRGDSKMSTWMYRIALNTAISMSARNKKHQGNRTIDNQTISTTADEDSGVSPEDIQSLQQAISTLSEIERAIILLHLEEKPYEEIAEITGLTRTNVGVRIMRIKKKLESEMKKLLGT